MSTLASRFLSHFRCVSHWKVILSSNNSITADFRRILREKHRSYKDVISTFVLTSSLSQAGSRFALVIRPVLRFCSVEQNMINPTKTPQRNVCTLQCGQQLRKQQLCMFSLLNSSKHFTGFFNLLPTELLGSIPKCLCNFMVGDWRFLKKTQFRVNYFGEDLQQNLESRRKCRVKKRFPLKINNLENFFTTCPLELTNLMEKFDVEQRSGDSK